MQKSQVIRVRTTIKPSGDLPDEVPAAGDETIRFTIRSDPPTDLEGAEIFLMYREVLVARASIEAFSDGANSAALSFSAPGTVGQNRFIVRLPEIHADCLMVEASEIEIDITTREHRATLACWGIDNGIRCATRFQVTVGAKCIDACSFAGRTVEVLDHAGNLVTETRLGEVPWPGTKSLYWSALQLIASDEPGSHLWTARLRDPHEDLPHRAAECEIAVNVIPAPEHVVTVRLLDQVGLKPVSGAGVLVGPYRGETDDHGVAQIRVCSGDLMLAVWKSGFVPVSRTISVAGDAVVGLEMSSVPDDDDQHFWL